MSDSPVCVILAAGEGSRMRPLTESRPKVMLPLAGQPLLEKLLVECQKAGIQEFIFVVGYREDKIHDYFGDGTSFGVQIRYVSQIHPEGTADALRLTQPLLKNAACLLLNGDIILQSNDIVPLCHADHSMLTLVELADVTGLGVVEVEGERIVKIHEKSADPPSRLANAGAYYFTSELFECLSRTPRSPRGEFEITDTIQMLIDSGNQVGYRFAASWRDVGYPWDLLSANEQWLSEIESKNDGTVEEGAVVKGLVSIGEGTSIRSGSYIVGPAIIGKHCEIGPNCFIRPATTIGDLCHIGAGVEIKNSIIMSGSKIPHLTYVGDSIVGENCNFGAGTQVANLRFDKSQIIINGRDTGRKKLGVITGDRVSTGVNSSINPGTLIGSGAFIGPSAIASGNIPAGSRVIR